MDTGPGGYSQEVAACPAPFALDAEPCADPSTASEVLVSRRIASWAARWTDQQATGSSFPLTPSKDISSLIDEALGSTEYRVPSRAKISAATMSAPVLQIPRCLCLGHLRMQGYKKPCLSTPLPRGKGNKTERGGKNCSSLLHPFLLRTRTRVCRLARSFKSGHQRHDMARACFHDAYSIVSPCHCPSVPDMCCPPHLDPNPASRLISSRCASASLWCAFAASKTAFLRLSSSSLTTIQTTADKHS